MERIAETPTGKQMLWVPVCRSHTKSRLDAALDADDTPVTALNRLAAWIHHHKVLYQTLLDPDYMDRQRI